MILDQRFAPQLAPSGSTPGLKRAYGISGEPQGHVLR